MPDMLAQGSAWLEDQRHAHLARPVIYERGGETIEILATIGRTLFEQVDASGGVLQKIESRDFLVRASDLILGGRPTLPKSGDRIHEESIGQVFIYEVMTPLGGNEPPYRYSDPNRRTLRIHTKHVGTEAIEQ
jgi:hypothetical protein